jgi:hypothetical protein
MAHSRQAAPVIGALAALVLLVAGCSTTATPAAEKTSPAPVTGSGGKVPEAARAPEPAPAPKPAPVVVAKPASIVGSEVTSTMFDNFTAYVMAVDGRAVDAERAGWNTPLTLPAGPRRLTVAFVRGVFTAQTDLNFEARPEAAYQLKFATDAQIFGKSSYCEFWIVDTATGEKVLAPTRVPLTKMDGTAK